MLDAREQLVRALLMAQRDGNSGLARLLVDICANARVVATDISVSRLVTLKQIELPLEVHLVHIFHFFAGAVTQPLSVAKATCYGRRCGVLLVANLLALLETSQALHHDWVLVVSLLTLEAL